MKPQSKSILAGLTTIACCTLPVAGADYPSTVLSQSPVGYWRLNETIAPSPIPAAPNLGSVGAAGDGAYLGGILRGLPGALPGDASDKAIQNSDTAARVQIPYRPEWNVNGPFSVEFWAKPGQTATSVSPGASTTFTSTTRSGWLFYQGDSGLANGNGWYFRLYRGATATGTANRSVFVNLAIDTNKWYHVVGVYDGTNLNLYVNGALATAPVALADTYRFVTDTNATMAFGNRSQGAAVTGGWFPYGGKVDEPAFYTSALSAAKILAHYQAGTNALANTYQATVLADGPAGYWRLDAPGDPAAVNAGSLGAVGDGTYVYGATPVEPGPAPSAYPGFAVGNTGVNIPTNNPGYVQLPPLNLNTNTVTITAWVKAKGQQQSYCGLVYCDQDTVGGTISGLNIGPAGGLELGYTWNNALATYDWASGLLLPDNQWAFTALIVRPDSATLCLHDGVSFQTKQNVFANPVQTFSVSTRLGSDGAYFPDEIFNGGIDEVAVFKRALSLGEVYSQYAAAVGGLPPQFFTDLIAPADPIYAGDTLTLSVDAGGTPVLNYQWQLEGTNLPGATASVLSKVVSTKDSGNYTVVVGNAHGTNTSAQANILVNPAFQPVLNSQAESRTVYVNGAINLWIDVSGGGLKYRWIKDSTNYPSATSSNLVLTASTNTAGTYLVIATNSLGGVTSAPIVITVVVPPSGSYAAVVAADAPTSWWRLNEAPDSPTFVDAMGRHDGSWVNPPKLGAPGMIKGSSDTAASFDLASKQYGEVPYATDLNSGTFTLEAWVKTTDDSSRLCPVGSWRSLPVANRGGYMFIKDDDNTWKFAFSRGNNFGFTYLTPPGQYTAGAWQHLAVTVSPAGIIYYVNGVGTGTFSGTGWIWNDSQPFRIGANVPGSALYDNYFGGTIDEVAYYPRVLASSNILAHYTAALYGTDSPPIITTQPRPQGVTAGSTVTFTARAEGSTPISLRWLKDSTPLADQTNATLTLTGVYYTDAGNYQLRATNSVGATNSVAAALTVSPPNPTFANLTNGLVLHLKFDGTYGDSSGRSNDGTPTGSNSVPSFVAGKLGSAVHYQTLTDYGVPVNDLPTGTVVSVTNNSYVTLGVRPDLQFSSNVNFTVAYWVRLPAGSMSGDLPFICNDTNSLGNPGYTFAPGYTNGTFAASFGALRIAGPSINDGNWHSLVHAVDRTGNAVTYLDGVNVNETYAGSVGNLDTGLPTNLGQDGVGLYPEQGSADLDDVGMWRRALTAYEAQSIYSVAQNYGKSFDTYGPVSLTINKVGASLELIWQAGTLLESDTVSKPMNQWTPVSGATAPYYKVTPAAAMKFYRVRL